MKYCEFCGKELQDNQTCDCKNIAGKQVNTQSSEDIVNENQPASASTIKPKKNKIALIIGGIAVILLLVIVLLATGKKVNPFDYCTYSIEGYNGIGHLEFEFDEYALAKEIFSKSISIEDEDDLEDALVSGEKIEDFLDGIDYQISKEDGISNGDVVTITFTVTGDAAKKVKSGSIEVTASDLPEIEKVDIFSYVELTFSGTDGQGRCNIETKTTTDEFINSCLYRLYWTPNENLKNNDKVELSIMDVESLALTYNKAPLETIKEYTVSGLDTLITELNQVPVNEVSKLAKEFLAEEAEILSETLFNYKEVKIDGAYLMRSGAENMYTYQIWIIISADEYIDGSFQHKKFWPFKLVNPVLKSDGSFDYHLNNGLAWVGEKSIDEDILETYDFERNEMKKVSRTIISIILLVCLLLSSTVIYTGAATPTLTTPTATTSIKERYNLKEGLYTNKTVTIK